MRSSRSLFHTVAFSTLLAAASFTTSAAHATDKITIMVGGYEKQIYLPAKLAERSDTSRTRVSTSNC